MHTALRRVSHSSGASDFRTDRELTEQAESARRQQGFVNSLPAVPQRSTVHQLAYTVSDEVVSPCHDTCKYAQNAPDTHALNWRARHRQAGGIHGHALLVAGRGRPDAPQPLC